MTWVNLTQDCFHIIIQTGTILIQLYLNTTTDSPVSTNYTTEVGFPVTPTLQPTTVDYYPINSEMTFLPKTYAKLLPVWSVLQFSTLPHMSTSLVRLLSAWTGTAMAVPYSAQPNNFTLETTSTTVFPNNSTTSGKIQTLTVDRSPNSTTTGVLCSSISTNRSSEPSTNTANHTTETFPINLTTFIRNVTAENANRTVVNLSRTTEKENDESQTQYDQTSDYMAQKPEHITSFFSTTSEEEYQAPKPSLQKYSQLFLYVSAIGLTFMLCVFIALSPRYENMPDVPTKLARNSTRDSKKRDTATETSE